MKKYLLTFAMGLLLALALAPAAFAADVSNQEEFEAAITEGNTINLTTNITFTSTVEVDKSVTINGNGHAINFSGSGSNYALKILADNVTLDGVTIDAASSGYGVYITGSNPTLNNCDVYADERGVSFDPTVKANAAITLNNTNIYNTEVSNYDTQAHQGDYRGLATYNLDNGTVTMTGGGIYGFAYSINALVDEDDDGLRDGNGTDFLITNATIKGWTALNMWSADSNYTFTNCQLVGINTSNGPTDGFSTIMANDAYVGNEANESVITIRGGSVISKQYGTAIQTPFGVDASLQTKFVFEQYDDIDAVSIDIYTSTLQAYLFSFAPGSDSNAYMASNKIQGLDENTNIAAYPLNATNSLLTTMSVDDEDIPVAFVDQWSGGETK
ncbi:MAG: pectate lyase-like adhesive domain-containing protein [Peptococcaceae bacterium]|nr:pectate lyase-like adhesive domain-containing protein [Peptococcaceae bacterium]